jgi:hypothetical protein
MAADNPYQPPVFADGGMQTTNSSEVDFPISPEDLKKAKAVIKEGDQFWVAILAMIFCSALGILLLGPWYFVRYLQWKSLAAKYPQLIASNSVRGSLPDKFLKAKLKLQICMGIGVVLLLLILLFALSLGVFMTIGVPA